MFVRIIPVGNVQDQILVAVVQELQNLLQIRSRILPKVPVPQDSYNHWRKQYDAEAIMNSVVKTTMAKFIDKNVPTLMLTDADLYYRGLNFVFGLEDPIKSTAIVSIARLKTEFYGQKPNITKLNERTTKEVIHEIGHHIGLEHCHNNYCVMSFSPSVQDVDAKQKEFCKECQIKMMTKGIVFE